MNSSFRKGSENILRKWLQSSICNWSLHNVSSGSQWKARNATEVRGSVRTWNVEPGPRAPGVLGPRGAPTGFDIFFGWMGDLLSERLFSFVAKGKRYGDGL